LPAEQEAGICAFYVPEVYRVLFVTRSVDGWKQVPGPRGARPSQTA
jgi:hypothetical protein